jgi:hypothetical protein
VKNYLDLSYQPLEIAVNAGDDIAKLLVALGVTIDFGLKRSLWPYASPSDRRSLKDWVDFSVAHLAADISQKTGEARLAQQEEEAVKIAEDTVMASAAKPEWKAFLQQYTTRWASNTTSADLAQSYKISEIRRKEQELERLKDVREFLADLQGSLVEKNAKAWKDIYPAVETQAWLQPIPRDPVPRTQPTKSKPETTYVYLTKAAYNRVNVPGHLVERYDELYEACFAGDNAKIQALCLPIAGQDPVLSEGALSPLNINVRLIDDTIAKYDASGEFLIYLINCGVLI